LPGSCRWRKLETQNANVPACRFRQKMGYALHHQPVLLSPADQPAQQ